MANNDKIKLVGIILLIIFLSSNLGLIDIPTFAVLGNVRPINAEIDNTIQEVTLDFESATGGGLNSGEEISVQVSPFPLREDYCNNEECVEYSSEPEQWKCQSNKYFNTGAGSTRDDGCAYREKIGVSCKYLKSGETIPSFYLPTQPLTCKGCVSGCSPPGYNLNQAWIKVGGTNNCVKKKDCNTYCTDKGYDTWRFGDKTCELRPGGYFKFPYIQKETTIYATATFEYNQTKHSFSYTIPQSSISFGDGVISYKIPECSPFPQTTKFSIHLVLGKNQDELSDIGTCNINPSVWQAIQERWDESHDENESLPTTPPSTLIVDIPVTSNSQSGQSTEVVTSQGASNVVQSIRGLDSNQLGYLLLFLLFLAFFFL